MPRPVAKKLCIAKAAANDKQKAAAGVAATVQPPAALEYSGRFVGGKWLWGPDRYATTVEGGKLAVATRSCAESGKGAKAATNAQEQLSQDHRKLLELYNLAPGPPQPNVPC